jgi:hypothetical protein
MSDQLDYDELPALWLTTIGSMVDL